jgi:hypothetical protein
MRNQKQAVIDSVLSFCKMIHYTFRKRERGPLDAIFISGCFGTGFNSCKLLFSKIIIVFRCYSVLFACF